MVQLFITASLRRFDERRRPRRTVWYVLFNWGFGVIQREHRLNAGLVRDFSQNHVIWQTLLTRAPAHAYYGTGPSRSYWTGCSPAGREGVIAAQVVPQEYDGVLAGGTAIYWMRFQMAQAWSGLVIKDLLKTKGETLTGAQVLATTRAEVSSCDRQDGVRDGVLGDPRTCHCSAKAAICGAPPAPRITVASTQTRRPPSTSFVAARSNISASASGSAGNPERRSSQRPTTCSATP